MSDNVVFEDYRIDVKNAIKEKCIQLLYDAGNEVISQVTSRSVRKTGQTAGSYETSSVDEGQMCIHVGSNYENAIWEEFGTGEFAENGDGRKGWWVFVEGQRGGGPHGGGKSYATKDQAKRAMAILRKKGLPAFYTRGKHARHPFRDGYNASKSKIIKRAEELFGGLSS